MDSHVAHMRQSRNAYKVSMGNRPLGRPRRRWKYIKMDLKEVVCDSRNWFYLAQDREYRDQWCA